jgi:hypothetical protein
MNQLGLALRIPIMTQKVTVEHEQGKLKEITEFPEKAITLVRLSTNQPFFMNNKGESIVELFDNFVAQIPDELKGRLFLKDARSEYEEIEKRLYDTFGAVIEGDTITKAANILGVRLPRNRWEAGELSRYISYIKQGSQSGKGELYKIKVLTNSVCHRDGFTLDPNDKINDNMPVFEHHAPLKPGAAYEEHLDASDAQNYQFEKSPENIIRCCPLGLYNKE